MEAGREFQFLEVIGTNVLAKEVVGHLSNLTASLLQGPGADFIYLSGYTFSIIIH